MPNTDHFAIGRNCSQIALQGVTLTITSKDDAPPKQITAVSSNPLVMDNSPNAINMTRKIESSYMGVRRYEDPALQAKARASMPIDQLKEKAQQSNESENLDFNDRLLLELLHWFKSSFFRWTNAPECIGMLYSIPSG
jgi:hypothetical protein